MRKIILTATSIVALLSVSELNAAMEHFGKSITGSKTMGTTESGKSPYVYGYPLNSGLKDLAPGRYFVTKGTSVYAALKPNFDMKTFMGQLTDGFTGLGRAMVTDKQIAEKAISGMAGKKRIARYNLGSGRARIDVYKVSVDRTPYIVAQVPDFLDQWYSLTLTPYKNHKYVILDGTADEKAIFNYFAQAFGGFARGVVDNQQVAKTAIDSALKG